MSSSNLFIAQQNVAKSHTFLNNIPVLFQKKCHLYVISEPPATVNSEELGYIFYPNKSSMTMIIKLNSLLDVEFIEEESNYYVTTIFLPAQKIKIHSVYYPPFSSKYASTAEPYVLSVLSKRSKSTLVLGDLNATTTILGGIDSHRGSKLTEVVSSFNWSLLNQPLIPTRKTSEHAIDWSISSHDLINRFSWSCTNIDKSLSDHCMIYLRSDFEQDFDEESRAQTFINVNKFIGYLQSIELNDLRSQLCYHLAEAANVSLACKRKKRKQEFFNFTCMLSKREVRRLLRLVKKHGKRFPQLVIELEAATVLHEKNVRDAKELHWSNKLKNCKHVGDVFVLMKKNKIPAPPVNFLNHDGKVVKDPEVISRIVLNHFFPEQDSILNLASMKTDGAKDSVITLAEIQRAIQMQKTNTPGHDSINRFIVLAIHHHFPRLLLETFNSWFENESLPAFMKKSMVTLILKRKELGASLLNLRPISLLTIISKLYERILANRIIWSISRDNSFLTNQFGFQKGISAEDAIKEIHDARICTNGMRDTVVALDVSGAFDNVTHRAIIRECINLHLSRSLVNSLIDYLSDRTVCLSIHPGYTVPIRKGVPQGSILGPLLFNIVFSFFLKTMDQILSLANIDSTIIAFADDCTLVLRHNIPLPNLGSTLQWLITQVGIVLTNIGLKLNLSKTQIIDTHHCFFSINEVPICTKQEGSILGVTFQSYGNFPAHFNKKIDNIDTRISTLSPYVSSYNLSLISRRALVDSAIYSLMRYAADVLMTKPLPGEVLKKFLFLDRKICCHLYGTSIWSSYRAVISILGRHSLLYTFLLHCNRRIIRNENKVTKLFETRSHSLSAVEPSRRRIITFDILYTQESVLNRQFNGITIFTDGSKVQNAYCTTAAFFIFASPGIEQITVGFKLPKHATAYQCERHAVLKALLFIYEECSAGQFTICTDCRSILESIVSFSDTDTVVTNIVDIIHRCFDTDKQIHLIWVKGHSSILGNQFADQACHSARDNYMVEEFVPLPNSFNSLNAVEQSDRSLSTMTSTFFTADPNYLALAPLTFHSYGDYFMDYFVAAFLSARAPTRFNLKRLRRINDSKCNCGQEQTVRHLFLYCPIVINKFASEFASSGMAAFLSSPRSEEDILSSKHFAKYVKAIAKPLLRHLEEINGHLYVDIKGCEVLRQAEEAVAGPSAKRKR